MSAEARPPSWSASLAVDPRDEGYTSTKGLLDEVVRTAVDSGPAAWELDTTRFQEAAARLYPRFGFRHVTCHDIYGTTMNRRRKPLRPDSLDVTTKVSPP